MHIKRRTIAAVVFLTLIIAILFFAMAQIEENEDASFDPATYGLPEEIAGYRLLVVQTPENNPCGRSDTTTVIVSSPYTDMGVFLTRNNITAVYGELGTIYPGRQWQISVVDPSRTAEEIIQQIKRWNTAMQDGCTQFSMPPIFWTPTPKPLS